MYPSRWSIFALSLLLAISAAHGLEGRYVVPLHELTDEDLTLIDLDDVSVADWLAVIASRR